MDAEVLCVKLQLSDLLVSNPRDLGGFDYTSHPLAEVISGFLRIFSILGPNLILSKSERRDLNSQRQPWKGRTLPIELLSQSKWAGYKSAVS